MRKLVMSLTYLPKIKPVKDGRCIQTIRKGRRVAVGDELLFHGWSGRPYRSKWDWRKRITVNCVLDCFVTKEGIEFWIGAVYFIMRWDGVKIKEIAELDFIDPPTGEALRDVLFGLNGAPAGPEEYQIIRWNNVEL